ncbi:MAG: hypothetical protein LBV45_08655 [Xanthomonadaceae bacterium]|jgi:hypothetical protein|nr:hypothetical protein [Xanthomonadaceae bacterium]
MTMVKVEEIMYTLGQIIRAVWPVGGVPQGVIDTILVTPMAGLLAVFETNQGRSALATESVERLLQRIPSDFDDPKDGVKTDEQGPFWVGYYNYTSAINRSQRFDGSHLERAGRFLFGDLWQSYLVRALQVNEESVTAWALGKLPIPHAVWADLEKMIKQHENGGAEFLKELDATAAIRNPASAATTYCFRSP